MSEDFVEDIITATSPAETPGEVVTDDAAAAAATASQSQGESTDKAAIQTDDDPSVDAAASDDAAPVEDPTLAEIATQLGWKPDHTGENYVDAKTYILRSREIQDSMRDHNKELKNQLQNLQGSVDSLKDHNERVYKADVTRMQGEIDRLRKEKKAAVEMADVDKVDELDKEIGNLEQTLSTPKPKPTPATNPVYDEWVQENQWYLTDDKMAAYADTVAQQYAGAPLERLYPLVRQKVAEVFPEVFEKQTPAAAKPGSLANPDGKTPSAQPKPVGPASPVEGSHKQAAGKSFTKADLSSDQLTIMNQFVKSGIMTEDQYISDLAKLQEA